MLKLNQRKGLLTKNVYKRPQRDQRSNSCVLLSLKTKTSIWSEPAPDNLLAFAFAYLVHVHAGGVILQSCRWILVQQTAVDDISHLQLVQASITLLSHFLKYHTINHLSSCNGVCVFVYQHC